MGLPFLIAQFGIHGFDQLRALQQMVGNNQEPERGGKTIGQTAVGCRKTAKVSYFASCKVSSHWHFIVVGH